MSIHDVHAYRDETDEHRALCGNDAAELTHDDGEVECWECRSIIGISDETDIAGNDVLRELVTRRDDQFIADHIMVIPVTIPGGES